MVQPGSCFRLLKRFFVLICDALFQPLDKPAHHRAVPLVASADIGNFHIILYALKMTDGTLFRD